MTEEVGFIRSVISPVVDRHYPSKANHEKMSLYDLVAFAVLAHRHFDGGIQEGLWGSHRGSRVVPGCEVQQDGGEAS
ncbi:MAG: hypothetical protein ACUVV4_08360 [Candidatus Bathyarchaeia archaeon]